MQLLIAMNALNVANNFNQKTIWNSTGRNSTKSLAVIDAALQKCNHAVWPILAGFSCGKLFSFFTKLHEIHDCIRLPCTLNLWNCRLRKCLFSMNVFQHLLTNNHPFAIFFEFGNKFIAIKIFCWFPWVMFCVEAFPFQQIFCLSIDNNNQTTIFHLFDSTASKMNYYSYLSTHIAFIQNFLDTILHFQLE